VPPEDDALRHRDVLERYELHSLVTHVSDNLLRPTGVLARLACKSSNKNLPKNLFAINILSEYFPDDDTPLPKHVGVLYLFLHVFY
jgi:hypothetical protein